MILYKNLENQPKRRKKLKIEYDLFENQYNNKLKTSKNSQKFLEERIRQIPYLLGVKILKNLLVNNFS